MTWLFLFLSFLGGKTYREEKVSRGEMVQWAQEVIESECDTEVHPVYLKTAQNVLKQAKGTVAGGYYPENYESYHIEIFYGEETYVYYSSAVNEVHVGLNEPGEAWVFTLRKSRTGQVYEAVYPMIDDGGGFGTSYAYSYSPAIIVAVEYTGQAWYYRADRH